MIVQIYEANNPQEAKKLAELGVDHIGVLVGQEKRKQGLTFKEARELFNAFPRETKKVALYLHSDLEEIKKLVREVRPDILHLAVVPEDLSPDNVREIKRLFPGLKIMRSIPVLDESSIEVAKGYENAADYLLLDTFKDNDFQVGNTGEIHDWDISRRIVESVKIPVILAGGLGPDNVAEAIKKVKPAGVDSKTKTDQEGTDLKDIEKVREFVGIAKTTAP